MDIQTSFLCPPGEGPIIRRDNGIGVCGGVGEVSEVIPRRALPAGVTHYASATIFVEREVLPFNPRLIAWGEIHQERGATYVPTVTRFAREILPGFARGGDENRLILEVVPSGQRVAVELDRFFHQQPPIELSQANTPLLWEAIQGEDMEGYILLFNEARRLGIEIIGGGLSISEAERTTRQPDFENNNELQRLAARLITVRMRQAAVAQLRQHPRARVQMYGGAGHNNRRASAYDNVRQRNFGQYFARWLGDRYLAVDLVLPYRQEVARTLTDRIDLVPQRGVTVITNELGSISVLYPRD